MNIVILGYGAMGAAVAARLVAYGHQVVGVRRRAYPGLGAPNPVITGDASDPTLYAALTCALPRIDAVLLAANPGLRRGRDNGLAAAAALVRQHLPQARFVYTGTSAVYADAEGAGVDEAGAVDAGDQAIVALCAIEREVLAHAHGLVLRVSALVGESRVHALERIQACAKRGEPCIVSGNLDRPFSFLHEDDLVQVAVLALLGGLGTGILNASSPERCTIGDYYHHLAQRAGVSCEIRGDVTQLPRRWINSHRLHAHLPTYLWKHF